MVENVLLFGDVGMYQNLLPVANNATIERAFEGYPSDGKAGIPYQGETQLGIRISRIHATEKMENGGYRVI